MVRTRAILSTLFVALASLPATAAETISVAVAANFTKVATDIAAKYEEATGFTVKLSFGATGALYTQITQGAPFDALLAADDKRTAQAIKDGFGVPDSDFTYAIGKLVLYSPEIDVSDGAALKAGAYQHLAIADPKAAPYGAAAVAVLDKLGLTAAATPKLVTGENITQTQQFIESGNAELGFLALSQVVGKPANQIWLVPQEDYPPIRQNAVLLKHGQASEAANAFLDYVQHNAEAAALIKAAGYTLE
jgi:molybdate transport system substrate-binding protein